MPLPTHYATTTHEGPAAADAKASVFNDASTPVDALIGSLGHEPLHLDGEAAQRLVGKGKLFTLWQEPGVRQASILAVDLHSYVRDASLSSNDVVLRIPQSIDGVPITRISADAFRPWLTYGVRVRLLMLPEGMQAVADEALAPLCVEHVALPASMKHAGVHHWSIGKLTAQPRCIAFHAAADNPWYCAREGSLYTKLHDGGIDKLAFQAWPYPDVVRVPEGVQRIEAGSFARNGETSHAGARSGDARVVGVGEAASSIASENDAEKHAPDSQGRSGASMGQPSRRAWEASRDGLPRIVECPASLVATADLLHDETVWSCEENDGGLALHLKQNRRAVVSSRYVDEDGFIYDIGDALGGCAEATLVKSPAFASKVRVPETVTWLAPAAQNEQSHAACIVTKGDHCMQRHATRASTANDALDAPVVAPVTRIAPRALPRHIEALDIPANVYSVEDGNLCRGARRLILAEGLHAIGARCFVEVGAQEEAVIVIPASVRSIGTGSLARCRCHFEALELMACIPASPRADLFIPDETHPSVPFNLALYDDILAEKRLWPERTEAILARIAGAKEERSTTLDAPHREAFLAHLEKEGESVLECVAMRGNAALVRALAEMDLYADEHAIDCQCEFLRLAHRNDCLAYLMRYKQERFGASQRPSARFTL